MVSFEPFRVLEGIVAPLERVNVDTDQIIPKQFLKSITSIGYEDTLFYDWRFLDDGRLNPDFELNLPRYRGVKILLTKDNFGCGSSREHAVWALRDYGFRSVIAPSFADIFYTNCINCGLLPISLPEEEIKSLFREVRGQEGYKLKVDLPEQRVVRPDGTEISFDMDCSDKERLINGWDQISLVLSQYGNVVTAYEKAHGLPEANI